MALSDNAFPKLISQRRIRAARVIWLIASTLLVTFAVCYMRSYSSSGPSIQEMESNMFHDSRHVRAYISNCGSDWHKLFASWEIHQRSAMRGDTSTKVIVWRCTELCGGLGDRQRGILTSFALALVTGRAFFIDSQKPVPFHRYFAVANSQLHWVFEDRLLRGRSVLEEAFMDTFPSVGDYSDANLSYYDQFDVVVQKNNFWRPLSVISNPAVTSNHAFRRYQPHILAGCVLNYLLVPKPDIQIQIHQVLKLEWERNRKVVALQVRSGDNQIKNSTVMSALVSTFRSCILDVTTNTTFPAFIPFLTSDSAEVVSQFKTYYANLLTFTGNIMHVDGFFGADSNLDAGFKKVVLDHIMLSQADTIVISRSGFGEFAALRGFKSYYLPPNCSSHAKVSHYTFPANLQAGVPAMQLNSVDDILKPSFTGRSVD